MFGLYLETEDIPHCKPIVIFLQNERMRGVIVFYDSWQCHFLTPLARGPYYGQSLLCLVSFISVPMKIQEQLVLSCHPPWWVSLSHDASNVTGTGLLVVGSG